MNVIRTRKGPSEQISMLKFIYSDEIITAGSNGQLFRLSVNRQERNTEYKKGKASKLNLKEIHSTENNISFSRRRWDWADLATCTGKGAPSLWLVADGVIAPQTKHVLG